MAVIRRRELAKQLAKLKEYHQIIVLTTGVFDVLNLGHLRYLEDARKYGDCLLVGIDDDALVRCHKGPDRPINTAAFRAELLASLKPVTATVVFHDIQALIRIVRPKFFIVSTTTGVERSERPELQLVMNQGGQVIFVPSRFNEHSTQVIAKLRKFGQGG